MTIPVIENGESNLSVRQKLNKLVTTNNYSTVPSLPNPIGYDGPPTIYNHADGKVYRYYNGGWIDSTLAADIEGQLQSSQLSGIEASKVSGQIVNAQIFSVAANKITGFLTSSQIGDGSVDIAKFANSIRPVELVNSLPGPPHILGRIVFLSTDGKLYRNTGAGWTAAISTADITGVLNDAQIAAVAASKITGQLTDAQLAEIGAAKIAGQLTSAQIASIEAAKVVGELVESQIANAAITASKFASTIKPIEVVAALPITANSNGRTVFLTTDGKLYRYYNGAWTTAIPAADITGQLTNAQLSEIAAAKISGQLTDAQIAAISAVKLVGQVTSNQITSLVASKLTGQLTDSQIADLSAAKIAGQLTNAQLQDIAATKITGQIVATQIADASISLSKFASTVRPVETVSTLPSSGNTAGRTVFLTTDGKLYRYYAGAWVSSVPASDITGTIDAAKIASLEASKITGQLTDAQIAELSSTKLAGLITNAQLAAIAATKITGQLTDAQLTSISTAKLTGQITGVQITDNAISSPKIAAGAVTTAKLVAGAVTANEIASNAVTATKIQAGAIGATHIASNVITASKIAIGDFENRASNPNFGEGDTGWVATGSGITFVSGDAANAYTGDSYVELGVGANTSTVLRNENVFPVVPGEPYALTAIARAVNSPNTTISACIRFMGNKSGSNLIGTLPITFSATDALYTSKTVSGVVPSGAAWAWVDFVPTASLTTGKYQIGFVLALRRTGGELIVDGAITADKIGANAVVAGKIAANAVTSNEIAANAVTAVKIAAGSIDASKITAGAIDAVKIVTGAVTSDKIAALAITSDKLDANSVVAGKIAAGAVRATEIAAGSITATKLLIGDTSNAFPDPAFNDPDFFTAHASRVFGVTSATGSELRYMGIAANVSQVVINSKPFAIEPDTSYSFSCAGWCYSGTAATFSIVVDFFSVASNGDLTLVSSSNLAVNSANTSGSDTARFEAPVTTPSNARVAQFRFQREAGGDGNVAFGRPLVRRMASGELIVDGAVIAAKIASQAITTEKLAAYAVTANEIAASAIVSEKLAANSVIATKIASAAITTEKLAVGSASNLINNTAFWQALDTWYIYKSGQAATSLFLNPPGSDWAGKTYPTLSVYQPDTSTVGYVDILWKRAEATGGVTANHVVPATAGKRYEFSVQLSTHRSIAELRIMFYLADGSASYSTPTTVPMNISGTPTDPDSWPRYGVRAVAPANAVGVGLHIRKLPTASGQSPNSYLFIHKPLVCTALPNATDWTEWSEGGMTLVTGSAIATGAIVASHITSAAVTSDKIAALAITTNKIAAGAVTADEIATNAITAVKISAGAISTAKIAAGAVTANEIATNAIVSDKISANAITTVKIATGAVTANELAANSIIAGKVAAGAISSTEIAANSITARNLVIGDFENLIPDNQMQDAASWNLGSASGLSSINPQATAGFNSKGTLDYLQSVTSTGYVQIATSQPFPVVSGQEYRTVVQVAKINANAVAEVIVRVHYLDSNNNILSPDTYMVMVQALNGGLSTTPIQVVNSFTPPANAFGARIQAYIQRTGSAANSGVKIGGLSVLRKAGGDLIVDGAIIASKIATNAVTTAAIAAGAVTANEIATNAVTAVKIAAGAVSAGKIAAGTVTASEIAAEAITAAKIQAGAVETAKIAVGAVQALQIASGAVTAGKIAALSITSDELAANSIIAGKIAVGAVRATELAVNAVTADKIAANAIVAGKIAADAIYAENIVVDTITVNKINTGAQQNIRNVQTLVRFITVGTTNWTVPAGVYYIRIKVWGGGGGGGYSPGGFGASAGGATGGYAEHVYAVTPGQVISITVGGGGTGAWSGSTGLTGGTSSVVVNGQGTVWASGGAGGGQVSDGVTASVPQGGTFASGIQFGIPGATGGIGTWQGGSPFGGSGGGAPLGGPPVPGGQGTPSSGAAPGGGGAGSVQPAYGGGNGARGEVHILY